MPSYNGHKNHAQWNISLWLSNDEGYYAMCRVAVRRCRTLDEAAESILGWLNDSSAELNTEPGCTPDGVKWSKTGIRAALSGGAFS